MKTNAVLVVLCGVTAVLPIGNASGFGTTLFLDDFESYLSSTFPPTGDWILVWNGKGTEHQIVSDAYSFTGENSLQLWGRPSWSSVAQRKFSTDAPVMGYDLAIRIDSIGTGGPGRVEAPGFFNREAYVWGAYYARVMFNHDTGQIEAEDGTILGEWEPGFWYQVRVVLDRSTNTSTVWIDGELRGEGLSTSRSDTDLIDALALMSDHAGVEVYYDDVRVFEVKARNASDPHPADAATDIPLEVILSWQAGSTAVSHDVYFGTSSPPAFVGNQTASSHDLGTLEPGTTYFWRIDEVNDLDPNSPLMGDVWSFTTVFSYMIGKPWQFPGGEMRGELPGDCDRDGSVTKNDVMGAMGAFLNPTEYSIPCRDFNCDGQFLTDELGLIVDCYMAVDKDSDGILDPWEVVHGVDPSRNDAGEDPDKDGYSNLEESAARTDPQDGTRSPSRMTREEAITILLEEVIKPESLEGDIIAFLGREHLLPGDKVQEDDEDAEVIDIEDYTWFAWINDDPQAEFAHTTRYVFINAINGRLKVLKRDWWPLVNDRAVWQTREELKGDRFVIFSTIDEE